MDLVVMGERIKRLREEKGISQADLARAIGASRVTIVSWEKGARNPKGYIQALAEFFQVSPLYITGDIDEKIPHEKQTRDLYEMLDRAVYYKGKFLGEKELDTLKKVLDLMLGEKNG